MTERLVKPIQLLDSSVVLQNTLATVNIQVLPDKGQRLLKQVQDLEAALSALNISTTDTAEKGKAFFFFLIRTLENVLFLYSFEYCGENSMPLCMVCDLYRVCWDSLKIKKCVVKEGKENEWNNSSTSSEGWWLPKRLLPSSGLVLFPVLAAWLRQAFLWEIASEVLNSTLLQYGTTLLVQKVSFGCSVWVCKLAYARSAMAHWKLL